MSNVAKPEVSMDKCLLDMPYETLFEIFRRLSKDKLFKISRLCQKLRHAAGDARLWKDVFIKYETMIFTFEDLYSEPWPVKAIDLSCAQIEDPVSSKTDQVVNVTQLDLSSIIANTGTTEAILAKYQCTELRLNFGLIDPQAFSKQTNLEVLSLIGDVISCLEAPFWLAQVLSNFKRLKTLDLTDIHLNRNMLSFVNILPTSLEKLFIQSDCPDDSFFASLAESAPNLKELELSFLKIKNCPSLLKFQFLEVLHIIPYVIPYSSQYIDDLHTYLIKFPALKVVYIFHHPYRAYLESNVKVLRSMLEPHGIIVESVTSVRRWWIYCDINDLWQVSKAM